LSHSMPDTLFVSDLHLDKSRPAITRLFLKFLDQDALHADALYILGDLFEVWVGDDDDSPEQLIILEALRSLVRRSVPVHVMHGNRDFLLADEFAQKTGCQLIDDPALITLLDENILLMHGDTLCTDDIEYMNFRSKVRSPEWRDIVLNMDIDTRRSYFYELRQQSMDSHQSKPPGIMDVNQDAVENTMRKWGVYKLIHGHTHRPAVHHFDLDGVQASRIVLGDWYQSGSALRINKAGLILEDLPVN